MEVGDKLPVCNVLLGATGDIKRYVGKTVAIYRYAFNMHYCFVSGSRIMLSLFDNEIKQIGQFKITKLK